MVHLSTACLLEMRETSCHEPHGTKLDEKKIRLPIHTTPSRLSQYSFFPHTTKNSVSRSKNSLHQFDSGFPSRSLTSGRQKSRISVHSISGTLLRKIIQHNREDPHVALASKFCKRNVIAVQWHPSREGTFFKLGHLPEKIIQKPETRSSHFTVPCSTNLRIVEQITLQAFVSPWLFPHLSAIVSSKNFV